MPTSPTSHTRPLTALLDLRRADEQRAERALGEAGRARAEAEAEHDRLLAETRRAREALDARRACA